MFVTDCECKDTTAKMRQILLLALLGLTAAKVDYTGHQVYRLYPNEKQIEILQDFQEKFQLDVWSEAKYVGDFYDVRIPPELKTRLDVLFARNRLTHEIFIEDVQVAIEHQTSHKGEEKLFGNFNYAEYHDLSGIESWITDFASENALASVVTIGSQPSFEGRTIRGIEISSGSGTRDFVINCGIHAREWVSPAACMYMAQMLVDDYESDATVRSLVNAVNFYFIPTSNPDGYVYTRAVNGDRMWRKTRSVNNGYLCDGVDPNRNFDDHWNNPTNGASGNACTDTFRGPSPFSEAETAIQKEFVESLPNVRAYIDVHAYSQYLMFPFGWTRQLPNDYSTLAKIASDSANAIQSVHGSPFITGTIANTIYVATGSSADYFYDYGNVKCSFAAELRDTGYYGFLLPADQIIPTAEETYEGIKVIASNVASGTCDW